MEKGIQRLSNLINITKVAESRECVDYSLESIGADLQPSRATIRFHKAEDKVNPLSHEGDDWKVEVLSHEGDQRERLVDIASAKLGKYWVSGKFPSHLGQNPVKTAYNTNKCV